MKKRRSPDGNKVTGFLCSVFGHHYVVSKEITRHIKEYECVYCGKQVTTDGSGTLTTLTKKNKRINRELMEIQKKRRNRKRSSNQDGIF